MNKCNSILWSNSRQCAFRASVVAIAVAIVAVRCLLELTCVGCATIPATPWLGRLVRRTCEVVYCLATVAVDSWGGGSSVMVGGTVSYTNPVVAAGPCLYGTV